MKLSCIFPLLPVLPILYAYQVQVVAENSHSLSLSRRDVIAGVSSAALGLVTTRPVGAEDTTTVAPFHVVTDPDSYSALAYEPPVSTFKPDSRPLILFLHGAGMNERDIRNLCDTKGEHAGLLPSLVCSNRAPKVLLDTFCILAPYSYQKRSFYEEPRSKLLRFLEWAKSDAGRAAGCPRFDPSRVFLFGFSDGATVGVELLTTRKFRAGVICSYGFTGPKLPDLALQRLKGIPVWVWHSADDVIFPVDCSDRLVKSLTIENEDNGGDLIRYSRFDTDPEGFTGSVRGHTAGITASKSPELYKWLASL
jgi:predicted peptidase